MIAKYKDNSHQFVYTVMATVINTVYTPAKRCPVSFSFKFSRLGNGVSACNINNNEMMMGWWYIIIIIIMMMMMMMIIIIIRFFVRSRLTVKCWFRWSSWDLFPVPASVCFDSALQFCPHSRFFLFQWRRPGPLATVIFVFRPLDTWGQEKKK